MEKFVFDFGLSLFFLILIVLLFLVVSLIRLKLQLLNHLYPKLSISQKHSYYSIFNSKIPNHMKLWFYSPMHISMSPSIVKIASSSQETIPLFLSIKQRNFWLIWTAIIYIVYLLLLLAISLW